MGCRLGGGGIKLIHNFNACLVIFLVWYPEMRKLMGITLISNCFTTIHFVLH